MVFDKVFSIHGILIRLTDERWNHISKNHNEIETLRPEVLATIKQPDAILKGNQQELFAIRKFTHLKHNLVVVYKEYGNDGFIITAFTVRNIKPYLKKEILWKKP